MSLRSPLSQAKGLGSAKDGVHHWKVQRITAIALIPLVIWAVFSIVGVLGKDFETARAWLASPAHAGLMIMLLISLFYHSALGIQVVIEDYVSHEWTKIVCNVLQQLLHFAMAVIGVLAIIRVCVGG